MAYENKVEMLWIERFMKLLLFIILLSTFVMLIVTGKNYFDEDLNIQQKIADHYQIPQESVAGLQCYKGFLHYPNQGHFSGVLSFSPSIKCDISELKALKHNSYKTEFHIYVLILLLSLFFVWLFKKT